MDPEELGAGGYEDESATADVLDAETPGESESAAASEVPAPPAHDPAAWLEADEGQQYLGQERLRYGREYTRTFERAVGGDAAAQAALQADRYGKRLWENHQRAVQQQAAQVAVAEARYQELAGKSAYERAAELEQNPALGRWFYEYAEYRQASGMGQSRQGTQPSAGSRLDDLYAELMADPDAALLSAADKAALHPAAFDDLEDAKGAAAMAKEFARRVQARSSTSGTSVGQSAPPAPSRRPQAAEAARAAAAKAPPIVSGPAATRGMTIDQYYAKLEDGTLSANDRAWYGEYRKNR